jgi:hypothetical protein
MLQTMKKGDCEVCARTEVSIVLQKNGNIWMCDTCYAQDVAVSQQNAHARTVIENARKADASIELKQDLFNAGTVSFVELQAAIENNTEIPADQKNYSVMVEVAARIEKLNVIIFTEEAALLAKKNERHALLVNAQNVAAKLHEKEREKFKQYDVNYKPVTPKSVKPKAVSPKKGFDKTAVFEAAKKYNVPAAQVQSIVLAKNLSPEDAAKHMATLMGLI